MKRSTLAGLLAVLGVLLGAAVLVRRAQEPEKPMETVLARVSADQIVQIGLTVSGATTTLKVIDGNWRIVAPFDDRAFSDAVSRLVNAMKDIRIGSVLSQNPARHAQYELNEANATRLQVFINGQDTPAFDYLVGKDATAPLSCYVRLPGSNEVRAAEGLSASLLLRSPELFRSPLVCAFEPEAVTSLSVHGAIEVSVIETSGTWTNAQTKRIITRPVHQDLSEAIRAWRAGSFVVSEPAGQGFEKPFLTAEAKRGGNPVTITVGGPVPGAAQPARFVRSSDRSAILVVDDTLTQAVIERLKKTQ